MIKAIVLDSFVLFIVLIAWTLIFDYNIIKIHSKMSVLVEFTQAVKVYYYVNKNIGFRLVPNN